MTTFSSALTGFGRRPTGPEEKRNRERDERSREDPPSADRS
jgi:hypothetical protein